MLLNTALQAQQILGSISNTTGNPIPFANICVVGENYGTISNLEGKYSLMPNISSSKTVIFSCIGYKSIQKTIESLKENAEVILEDNTYQLKTVNIMPDSSLRSLLRDAYRNIPNNYPCTPTNYKGFYRTALKDGNNSYIRLMEALVTSYKTSYQNSQEGVSELLKSRKYIHPTLSKRFEYYYYGGMNYFHSRDYVKDHSDILKGHKDYDYDFKGLTSYRGNEVYKISFKHKDANEFKNTLFVDKKTLAYLRIDFVKDNIIKQRKDLSVRGLYELSSLFQVNYETDALGFYYLKSQFSNWNLLNNSDNSTYSLTVEYATTEFIRDSVKKIPYSKQMSETFTPALETIDYLKSDWKDYNTIVLDFENLKIDTVTSQQLFNTPSKINNIERIQNQLMRLNFVYGFEAKPINLQKNEQILSLNNLIYNKKVNFLKTHYDFFLIINYSINNTKWVYWKTSTALYNSGFSNFNELGYKRTIPIKTIGKDILFEVDGAWQWGELGYSLGTASSTQHFNFGGKTFKQEKIQAYTGVSTYGIKANGTLSIQLSNRLYLDLTGAYLYPLNSSDVIILKERSGFYLTRKTASESLSNDNIDYSINGISTTSSNINLNNWSLSVGVKIKL